MNNSIIKPIFAQNEKYTICTLRTFYETIKNGDNVINSDEEHKSIKASYRRAIL